MAEGIAGRSLTGKLGVGEQRISKHAATADLIHRPTAPASCRVAVGTMQASMVPEDRLWSCRCSQSVGYDKPILVGNGHTFGAAAAGMGLRTRWAIHRTIPPLVA